MQTIRDAAALDYALAVYCANDEAIALVPTMGALHAGHMALIHEAKQRAKRVVATIFVNPLQFGANEDFGRYPRQEEKDAAMLDEAGCDLLWLPAHEDIYPAGFATTISVKGIGDRWEGEARPGHFDGVATVVGKLLMETLPNVAVFGEKDFQQLAVVRRLAADLNLCREIIGVPTVRDEDGLALSSRNAYLTKEERKSARRLPETLFLAAAHIRRGEDVTNVLRESKEWLLQSGFAKVDYVALVDPLTLEPLDKAEGPMRLIAAATIGTTRLIDNVPVEA